MADVSCLSPTDSINLTTEYVTCECGINFIPRAAKVKREGGAHEKDYYSARCKAVLPSRL